jgi:hypothetical protein
MYGKTKKLSVTAEGLLIMLIDYILGGADIL